MALKAIVLGLTVVPLGSGLAEAVIASGGVGVGSGDLVDCIVPNVGAGTARNVHIVIQFYRSDGGDNGAIVNTCGTVAPGHACVDSAAGEATDFGATCLITFSGASGAPSATGRRVCVPRHGETSLRPSPVRSSMAR
jgi:hypothetical protein